MTLDQEKNREKLKQESLEYYTGDAILLDCGEQRSHDMIHIALARVWDAILLDCGQQISQDMIHIALDIIFIF